ncbi:MAG: DNA-processing protein DprA [Syntrophorhabdaceae bacterium]|nr:DNA-processing protein DprA [Syntrophorhabdaceae bacterium]
MEEIEAIIALSMVKGVSRHQKRTLLDGVEDIPSLFKGASRIKDEAVRHSISTFRGWDSVDRTIKRVEDLKGRIITIKDTGYPPLLKTIPDAPILLYMKGPLNTENEGIAIVGSRKATFTGLNMAEKIGETLSLIGITIVSGLARGIDAYAHKGGLKGEGKTIGVLGCGIDVCYPAENRYLFERIGNEGLLITEYPPGERPMKYHFPERNRIIAGLSKGVLVVEASNKSGSLITARLALEYGREVMAIPGDLFNEQYKGTNRLIKEGAKLVEGIEDIVAYTFPYLKLPEKKDREMDGEEKMVYDSVGYERTHVDEVIEKTGMGAKGVLAVLTRLEMKDLIHGFPGGFYVKR